MSPLGAHRARAVDAAQGSRLRDGPLKGLRLVVGLGADDRQVLRCAPEGAGAIVVAQGCGSVDIADLHLVGRASEARYLHVVGHLQKSGLAIVAGLEEHGIAVGAELVVEHALVDAVHLCPDGLHVVCRAEDEHVGTEQFLVHGSGEQDAPAAVRHLIIIGIGASRGRLVGKGTTAHLPNGKEHTGASLGTQDGQGRGSAGRDTTVGKRKHGPAAPDTHNLGCSADASACQKEEKQDFLHKKRILSG